MNKAKAERLHTVIAAGRAMVDDKTASIAPELYGRMKQVDELNAEIPLIKAGTRINWDGTLKRAAVDVWDTPQNNPDNAPTLWEDIAYKLGERIIPQTITAGLAFSLGELGWWGDALYRSLADINVWTPEQSPENWEVVEG